VLLYEMLTGLPPFYDENTNEMYKKILQDPLQFPPDIDPHARSLLIRLLDRDPAKRLGANGAAEIKSHRFFESIDWRRLLQKKIQPTFRPNVVSNLVITCSFASANRYQARRYGHQELRPRVHAGDACGLRRRRRVP